MSQYKRKAHFELFRSQSFPYAGLTVNMDVSEVLYYSRERGCSFTLLFTHLIANAANAIPEFRQRIKKNGIIEYDECETSHTELNEQGTFNFCQLKHSMDLESYLIYAKLKRESARKGQNLDDENDPLALYYISAVPWLSYTQMIQPVSCGDDSIPRFSWGKYTQNEASRYIMPVSVLVNHALCDGIHIAAFYQRLEQEIEGISQIKTVY